MKKTLLEYVQTNEKEYAVRIKTTFEPDNDTLNRIERHLKKYDVVDVKKPERIMLQANPIDFPENHGWEIYVTDATTRLPVSYDVLHEELVKLLCIHASQIKVRNPEAPREEEAETQDEEQKEQEYHVRLTDRVAAARLPVAAANGCQLRVFHGYPQSVVPAGGGRNAKVLAGQQAYRLSCQSGWSVGGSTMRL